MKNFDDVDVCASRTAEDREPGRHFGHAYRLSTAMIAGL